MIFSVSIIDMIEHALSCIQFPRNLCIAHLSFPYETFQT